MLEIGCNSFNCPQNRIRVFIVSTKCFVVSVCVMFAVRSMCGLFFFLFARFHRFYFRNKALNIFTVNFALKLARKFNVYKQPHDHSLSLTKPQLQQFFLPKMIYRKAHTYVIQFRMDLVVRFNFVAVG